MVDLSIVMLNYQRVDVGVYIYIYMYAPFPSDPSSNRVAARSGQSGSDVANGRPIGHPQGDLGAFCKRGTHEKLVGGFNHLENMKVNGKDHPIYEMENKIHV